MKTLVLLLAACAVACSLNPQPLPPDRDNTAGFADDAGKGADDGGVLSSPDAGMASDAGEDGSVEDAGSDAATDGSTEEDADTDAADATSD